MNGYFFIKTKMLLKELLTEQKAHTVSAVFAEVRPSEEIIASASAPTIPLVANAFNNASFVQDAFAIASPVVASIKPNFAIKDSFSVADKVVFAKLCDNTLAVILSSVAIIPADTSTCYC